ncbi:MAG: precorrin-3B C(17)-methyltransferase [Actinobacteria bacterium]|nr:precorrin-3B C(17)-methyltransferase [Actinomycetota bacterium]
MNTLYVVGIGPGNKEGMTFEADHALNASEVIVGYKKYVELVRPYYPEKEFFDTGMTHEVDRCRAALDIAASGKTVSVVCSGDGGIYGMAGLVFELSVAYPGVAIEVIAGVTAAASGAALLGAPLTHDFAVISLSDLLTPWERIEKRLECAAKGDFCICMYNPSSHKRHDYLQKACEILLDHLSPETVCGIARNIGRDGEGTRVMTLGELHDTQVDMFTTVFIGNSNTKEIGGKMVTPRGYRDV